MKIGAYILAVCYDGEWHLHRRQVYLSRLAAETIAKGVEIGPTQIIDVDKFLESYFKQHTEGEE